MRNQLWHLDYPDAPPKAEWDQDRVKSEIVKCPADPGFEWEGKRYAAHQRGGRRLTDLSVVLSDGPLEDFVWTWSSECLVQDRTLELLHKHRLTGFETKPVTARFEKSAERPPRLWELVLTGWAGMARPESGIHLDEAKSCAVCGHLTYTGLVDARQLIDESRWDGSDFFMVWPMPKFIFVTERVVRAVRENRLTGVRPQPASELKPSEGYSPGRLSYWMPEERARELGDPLGIY